MVPSIAYSWILIRFPEFSPDGGPAHSWQSVLKTLENETMAHKLTWKRKNGSGQHMTHCGRYWFAESDIRWSKPRKIIEYGETVTVWYDIDNGLAHTEYQRDEKESIRLWHEDSGGIVGYFGSVAETKRAAQTHLESLHNPNECPVDGPLSPGYLGN